MTRFTFILWVSQLSVYGKQIVQYDTLTIVSQAPNAALEKKIFSDPDLNYVQEEAKDLNSFDRFMEWLSRKLFGKADTTGRVDIYNIITWVMIIGGLVLIILILKRSDFIGVLKGKSKPTVFNFGDVDEDIRNIDFDSRITAAVIDNDLRLAIRWYYLKQLNALNSRSLITWQSFKTNIDYAKELKLMPVATDFNAISRIYDYVWYGQYGVGKENYLEFEQKFKEFENKLSNV